MENINIEKESAESKEIIGNQETRSRSGILLFLVLFGILTVAIISWLELEKMKAQSEKHLSSTLGSILKNTQESLRLWSLNRKQDTLRLASSARVRDYALSFNAVSHKKEVLAQREELIELREYIKPELGYHSDQGFFIVTPDLINIGSMRDMNMGKVNLLKNSVPGFFDKIFKGETAIAPPVPSKVPLPNYSGKEAPGQPTMFTGAPVFDDGGSVIAALMIRIDPLLEFTRFAQLGRIVKSGETYAFDKSGRLITESRFNNQLRAAGLIKKGEQASLNITLRDPGVNLLEGARPDIPRQEQPLTFMASRAIAGNAGENLLGYRDYRGVMVAGSWLWDEELGFGIATEIDIEEAYGHYYSARRTVFLLVGLTILVFSISFFLLNHRRRQAAMLAKKVVGANKLLNEEAANRDRTVKQLVASEQTLAQAQKIAHVGSWEWDITTGSLEWSDETYRIFGLIPQECAATYDAFIGAIHPDDRDNIGKAVNEAVYEHEPYGIEHRVVRPDGSERVVHEQGIVYYDGNGEPASMIGTVQDITERKQAEKELAQFKTTLDNTMDCVFMFYPVTLKFFYVNQGAVTQFGYSSEELLDMTPVDIKPAFNEERFREVVTPLIEGPDSAHTFETVHKHKDGTFIPVEIFLQYIEPPGESGRFVAIVRDISERKKAEKIITENALELERVNRELEEFNYVASHELQEPLRTISSYCSFLANDVGENLSERASQDIEYITDGAKRMSLLVKDLLLLSRVGRAELEVEQVNLNECMQTVKHDLEARIKDTGGEVTWDDLPVVSGSSSQLSRVLQNLVGNALKFCGEAPPAVNVSSLRVNGMWKISVRDNGIGMEPQYINQIFRPFKRLHGIGQYEGTGIGLSVCEKIIERHGGAIMAESEPGHGSEFIFTLKTGSIN